MWETWVLSPGQEDLLEEGIGTSILAWDFHGQRSLAHGGVSAPSFCAFPHRVAFKEVSGHQVLIKSGPGNRFEFSPFVS